jgi:hypothetical protein
MRPDGLRRARLQRLTRWQEQHQSVLRFGRGRPPQIEWPASRARADESLGVENLRRAYHAWKAKRGAGAPRTRG